jgi:hypothetical protein
MLFRYVESKWALVILAYGDRLDELLDRIAAADRRSAAAVTEPTGMAYCQRVLDAFWMRSEMFMEARRTARYTSRAARPAPATGHPPRRQRFV